MTVPEGARAAAPSMAAPAVPDAPRPGKAWERFAPGWVGVALSAPLIVAMAMFVFYPLVKVFAEASSDGQLADRYLRVFTDPVSRNALTTTLVDSALVVVIVIGLGAGIAWVLHTTERRWVRVVLWTTALVPFWMGVIVKNYSIFLMLSANGPVNRALMAMGVVDQPLPLLFSKTAVVAGIAYSMMPYAVLTLYSSFVHVDRSLLTAAQTLGASRMRALAGVAFPIARGGIGASMALVFVLSIGFYVTPVLLGGAQAPFMASRINQQVFALYDFPGASASAAVLLVIAVVTVGLVVWLIGGRALKRAVMQ
jgi:ABC-type spermidine/putrescine transport system permease subunit I